MSRLRALLAQVSASRTQLHEPPPPLPSDRDSDFDPPPKWANSSTTSSARENLKGLFTSATPVTPRAKMHAGIASIQARSRTARESTGSSRSALGIRARVPASVTRSWKHHQVRFVTVVLTHSDLERSRSPETNTPIPASHAFFFFFFFFESCLFWGSRAYKAGPQLPTERDIREVT
ncbi:hypothetical protein EDB84DRAFT_1075095 [Lactarius hengduanensis]|nr:hypothetical protein EDB84DRAFT_1075095 [Lactarius hengduanensis]